MAAGLDLVVGGEFGVEGEEVAVEAVEAVGPGEKVGEAEVDGAEAMGVVRDLEINVVVADVVDGAEFVVVHIVIGDDGEEGIAALGHGFS